MQSKRILFVVLSALIVALFLITRLYNFPSRYAFDYDQQDAANAAWHIIVDKKPILIGQETSIGGLFIGPALYWFQSIAMYFSHLNPLSLGYLGVFVSLATLIILFLVVCEISNKWQGLIAAFLYAVSARLTVYDISSHAVTYMMLFSLLIFWVLYKIVFRKRHNLLPLLTFILSFTLHVHLALFLLGLPVLITLLWQRPKFQAKYLILSIFTFLLPLSTFALFESRHHFLITHNLITFSSVAKGFSIKHTFQALNTFMSLMVESVFAKTTYSVWIFLAIISIFAYLMKIAKNTSFLAVALLILFFRPMSLIYQGPIPEYYFLPVVPIFLIVASYIYFYLAKRSKIAFILTIAAIVFYNFAIIKILEVGHSGITYAYKESAIASIIADTGRQTFNVYYQMPRGFNTGYQYLFKWHKRFPQEGGENLYIIEIPQDDFDPTQYYQAFPKKKISINRNGSLYIVSVK